MLIPVVEVVDESLNISRARRYTVGGAKCAPKLFCLRLESMGIWKAPISLRIRQELRRELEEFAARERRTLGNLGEILLESAFERLKSAGSTHRLFHREVPIPRNPGGNYGRKPNCGSEK